MPQPLTLGRKIDTDFARGVRDTAARMGEASVVDSRIEPEKQ